MTTIAMEPLRCIRGEAENAVMNGYSYESAAMLVFRNVGPNRLLCNAGRHRTGRPRKAGTIEEKSSFCENVVKTVAPGIEFDMFEISEKTPIQQQSCAMAWKLNFQLQFA
jgi:hypothetical protein